MMKHPLTSKERRGLLAVAAAALLCIASGFIFRNCSSSRSSDSMDARSETALNPGAASDDNTDRTMDSQSINKRENKERKNKKKKIQKKKPAKQKKKTLKTYPTRDPLSEPCDQ
ncbi:MAG: hypothetical protein K2G85_03235 [Muribaculaceae bacterium]|nr:hypothetical protein [Muribaculaceae bacterium]